MQMIAIFNSLVLFKYVANGERRSSGCKEKKTWEMGFILCIYIAAIERQQTKPDEWQWLFILPHYSQWLYFGLITALSSCTMRSWEK